MPDGLPSGVYAVELRAKDAVDHVPLVARPHPEGPRARTVVLLPTFTYIAYGNERMVTRLDFEGDQLSDHAIHPGHRDLELAEHPEWGLSLYDLHSDGSTCAYSTHLRPIPNLRPDYRAWLQDAPRHLSADLYLVDWLTERGYPFDVITGSHPEYVSERMLDALESHLDTGGSLMHLGEDVLASRSGLGGIESPEVRSDMTWLDKPAGGAVFSVGSNVLDEMLKREGK